MAALAGGDRGVEEAGAVEVGAQAESLPGEDSSIFASGQDAAAAEIRRLLDHEEARARFVAVSRVAHASAQGLAAEFAPSPSSGMIIAPEIAAALPARR